MSKDELIKALQEQERIAKSSTYVANKGSDYEETKKNYYSGLLQLIHNAGCSVKADLEVAL